MHPHLVGFVTLACLVSSVLLGNWLRSVLPAHHLDLDAKDTVRVAMALVATMAALVLGLLVASTKSAYDTERNEITQMASRILFLDRLLKAYGPEADGARTELKEASQSALSTLWPVQPRTSTAAGPSDAWSRALPKAVFALTPHDESQSAVKSQAVRIATELGEVRWLLFEQAETSISKPMLIVVVAWLAILFLSLGLFAPRNYTVFSALVLSAASAAGALYLIFDLDTPFSGTIMISSQPMQTALEHMIK